MRIEYLKLPAFGAFTDKLIPFTETKGLHVVYGPNEAGKSTMLRAVGDALFGIPRNSSDGFLHGNGNLRVEVKLSLASGETITFKRRKGNKNTMLDQHDAPLDEAILAPYTAGLDRKEFEDMFGLDHQRLRAGGRELLQSGGSLSEALFAAASGIGHLRDTMSRLEKQAGNLYKPSGSKPIVNSLVFQYQKDKKALEQASLSPRVFSQRRQAYDMQKHKIQSLEKTISETKARQARLERLRRTKPLLTRRDQLVAEREQLGVVPVLPPDSEERYWQQKKILRQAQAQHTDALDRIHQLEEKAQALAIPESVLQQEDAIDQLQEDLGQFRQRAKELPELENQIELNRQQALAKLRQLCPGAIDLAEADKYRLPLDVRMTVEELVEQSAQLTSQLKTVSSALQSRQDDLTRKQEAVAELGPTVDISSLQELVDTVRQEGNLEQQQQVAQSEAQEIKTELDDQLQRLTLWTGTLQDIVGTKFPLSTTIVEFAEEHRKLQEQINTVEREIRDLEKRQISHNADLKKLEAQGHVPSEERLLIARRLREDGWQLVRKAWIDGQRDATAEAAFSPDKPLVSAYEESVQEADDIADALLRESERVARKAALEMDLQLLVEQMESAKQERQKLADAEARFQKRWLDRWSGTGLHPLSPKEMQAWREKVEELLQKHEQWQQREQLAWQRKQCTQDYRSALQEQLQQHGIASHGSLVSLVKKAAAFCQQETTRQGEHRQLAEDVKEQERALVAAKERHHQVDQEHQAWSKQWAQSMKKINLGSDVTTKTAQQFIATAQELIDLVDDLAKLEKSRKQHQQYIQEYSRKALDVMQKTRLRNNWEDIPRTVKGLDAKCKEARDNRVEEQGILAQINGIQDAKLRLERTIAAAKGEISSLMQASNCNGSEELEATLQRHQLVLALQEKIDAINEQLVGVGDGLSVDALANEAQHHSPDAIKVELEQIEVDLVRLNEEIGGLHQSFGVIKKEYEEQAQGASNDASVAAEKAQETLTQMAEQVGRYMSLRVASLVLKRSMDQYRDQHQSPVLRRTGEVFRQLTNNGFSNVVMDYDTNDTPVIKGLRNEESVAVDGMSDGTQDQLYLALRLASMEHYLDQGEPMPFIVDDVLINFDDQRSHAALLALGKLAHRTQVILFTHHRAIMQMAEAMAPTEHIFLHEIGHIKA